MKIFLICSKHAYDEVMPIKKALEKDGHEITLANSFEEPAVEPAQLKERMFRHNAGIIADNDAALVLNFEKHGIENYIGGATFLDMYDAYRLHKKIFLYNPIPESIIADEVRRFNPVILDGDLSKIS